MSDYVGGSELCLGCNQDKVDYMDPDKHPDSRPPYYWFPAGERCPVEYGKTILAETLRGTFQGDIRSDAVYDYIDRNKELCKVSEILKWRGCGGFDF